jgi:peptidyl-prolyl cis-trans isomerase C
MKLFLVPALLVYGFLAISPAAHAQSKKSNATAYATVGDGIITKEVYDQALKEAIASGRQDSPQLRNEVRNILVNQELLVQEALKMGLDKKPEHRRAIQNLRQNYYVQLMLREHLVKNPINDDQVRKAYDERYSAKAVSGQSEYKISSWVFSAEKEAQAMIERLSKGDSIEKAEKALSLGSQQRGVQDAWVAQTNLAKPVLDVIVYLGKGGHTLKPIRIGNAWHVVRLDDQRPMRAPSFDEAKASIRSSLVQKSQAEYLARLRSNTTININP